MTKEEAIQALNEIFDDSKFSRYESWYGTAMEMAIEALQAEPVKHGAWKYYNYSDINNPYVGWYECTVCKHHEYSERDYCPNCGAEMRGK